MNENNTRHSESEQAMRNVLCPKLARTLIKLQQVSNEFSAEYGRALNLGVIDTGNKMGDDFNTAFYDLQQVIAKLMTELLQVDLDEALPLKPAE